MIKNAEYLIYYPSMAYIDGVVKSPKTVIAGLIRYPEAVESTGFRLPPE
ncbi:MAG: hypothetical protein JRD69_04970 [Deltaproteobacteria bacterium]|nr:hypothetical protein [Deltaproteobacteria bacterium]